MCSTKGMPVCCCNADSWIVSNANISRMLEAKLSTGWWRVSGECKLHFALIAIAGGQKAMQQETTHSTIRQQSQTLSQLVIIWKCWQNAMRYRFFSPLKARHPNGFSRGKGKLKVGKWNHKVNSHKSCSSFGGKAVFLVKKSMWKSFFRGFLVFFRIFKFNWQNCRGGNNEIASFLCWEGAAAGLKMLVWNDPLPAVKRQHFVVPFSDLQRLFCSLNLTTKPSKNTDWPHQKSRSAARMSRCWAKRSFGVF